MIKFALAGCGRIAKRHADLLSAGQIAGARVVAVCDVDAARAKSFAARYAVPGYESLSVMLSRQDIDVVSVLTPSGLHAQHVIQAVGSGRHVVVEKPMALTLADADAMIFAAERANVRLFVVKQNRFNVPIVKARQALDQGRLGQLVLGTVRVRWCRDQSYYAKDRWRGTWAFDGGVVSNQASHHVDILSWFMGPVASVHARGLRALANIEAEDTAVATLRFSNGALGIVEATAATRPKDLEGSFSILGSGGTIEIGGFAMNKVLHWHFVAPEPADSEVMELYSVNPPDVYGFGHRAYYEHVVDCLSNNKPALVDGHEGRASLELVAAIYESMANERTVTLPLKIEHSRLGKG